MMVSKGSLQLGTRSNQEEIHNQVCRYVGISQVGAHLKVKM